MEFVSERGENTLGNGENSGFKRHLLHHCVVKMEDVLVKGWSGLIWLQSYPHCDNYTICATNYFNRNWLLKDKLKTGLDLKSFHTTYSSMGLTNHGNT